MMVRMLAQGIDHFRATYRAVKHGIFNIESGSERAAQDALIRIENLMQQYAAGLHIKRLWTTMPDGTRTIVDQLDPKHPAAAFVMLGIDPSNWTPTGPRSPQDVAMQVLIAIGRDGLDWRRYPALHPLVIAANEWDLCRDVERGWSA